MMMEKDLIAKNTNAAFIYSPQSHWQQLAVKSWKWPCDLWLKKTARNMRPVVVHRPPPLQHSIKAAMFSHSPEPELTYREIALCSV